MLSQMTRAPSFSWLSNIPLCIHIVSSLSIHPVSGHLGWFPILAVVNNTAISMWAHVVFGIRIANIFKGLLAYCMQDTFLSTLDVLINSIITTLPREQYYFFFWKYLQKKAP